MVDLILHRGVVLTQSVALPRAEAIAVTKGRIVAVGTDAEIASLAGVKTERVDLGGATVVPGLIDAHAHIWKIGHLLTTMVDLRRVRSLAELEAKLRIAAANRLDMARADPVVDVLFSAFPGAEIIGIDSDERTSHAQSR